MLHAHVTTPANQDKIIVAARYVNSLGIPCERMVEIKESVNKTDAGTAKDVISSLRENEIDVGISNVRFHGINVQAIK